MPRQPFGTLLVGLNALRREGLSRILPAADFDIVGSASRVDDLVLSSLPQHQSILLIVDAGDDPGAAVEQIKLFRNQHTAARIAVLANHYQIGEIVSAFRVGANAYFINVATCDAFIKSLELVMLGETIVPSEILPLILDFEDGDEYEEEDDTIGRDIEEGAEASSDAKSGYTPRLSNRERSILHCLVEGDSNKAIARKIDIAEATVKVHVKAILRKIRVRNRTQAAIWAMNNSAFIEAADNGFSESANVPIDPSLSPLGIRSVPGTQKNNSTSLPVFIKQVEGASHAVLPNIVGLVRKGISRK